MSSELEEKLQDVIVKLNASLNVELASMINKIVNYDKSDLWALVSQVSGAKHATQMRIDDFTYFMSAPTIGVLKTSAIYYGFKIEGNTFLYTVAIQLFKNPLKGDILAPDVIALMEYKPSSSDQHLSSAEYAAWINMLVNKPIRDDVVTTLNNYKPGNKLAQLIQQYGEEFDKAFTADWGHVLEFSTTPHTDKVYDEINKYLGGE